MSFWHKRKSKLDDRQRSQCQTGGINFSHGNKRDQYADHPSTNILPSVWEEIRMLTVIFERKAHKYCSPKCNLLKCLCFYQISGDHFQLDRDNKHTTHSDISHSRTHLHRQTYKRVLHWSCPVSSTAFQSQNVI